MFTGSVEYKMQMNETGSGKTISVHVETFER